MGGGFSRRKRRIAAWGTVAVSSLAVVTALVIFLRPDADPYRAGEKVEGITSTLGRSLPPDVPQVLYTEVAEAAGIDFTHFPGKRSTQLPEDMGSGAAWGDYDGDGDFDLYLVNIAGPLTLSPEELARSPGCSRLYRNRGDGTFENVTEASGTGFLGTGMAAAWADYDGDGALDLAVSSYDRLVLYRNRGDGTFEDVSDTAGFSAHRGFWAGLAWGDYDRDGDLDLYVCGYVKYKYDPADLERATSQYDAVVPFTLNPSSYEPHPNLLLRNDNGKFRDVAVPAGVDNPAGRSLSAVWTDFDEDGDLDLYVANDISDNVMYRNRGDGRFDDVSHRAWVADYRGAMGLAVGDWDNDRDQDIFVTHWIAQENALYDNTLRMPGGPEPKEPRLQFFDIADQTGLGQIALSYIGWGTSFLDYDNDGRQDLAVVNGSTFQEPSDPSRLVPMRNLLFWNKGPEEGFFEVGTAIGDTFTTPRVGRGLAVADYDNDGDADLLVVVFGGQPLLLRNDGGNRSHWLKVRIRGAGRNLQGLGSRVEIEAGGEWQCQVIGAQSSYLSQNAPEALFGLGAATRVDRVRIHFPGGQLRELQDVAADQILQVVEEER
jgi:hypothetical protein